MTNLNYDAEINRILSENNITEQQLKKRWRQVAMEYHPDRGGDPEEFIRFRQAYETCLAKLKKLSKCPDCRGLGRVYQHRGFFTTTVICPTCKGAKKR